MGFLGGLFGSKLGGKITKRLGLGRQLGSIAGGALGSVVEPFKTGGKVGKGKKRGEPVLIMAHAGETVLPLNAKPTKTQKKFINKNKKSVKFCN